MMQTRDTKNIFCSIHNERQYHTPEPPKKKPVSATWCKRMTPRTSSVASTTNMYVNITPQNPPKKTLLVPLDANAWHQEPLL